MITKLREKLFQETSIYSIVATRIMFGLLMLYQCSTYILKDAVYWQFIYPRLFRFKYYGFEWIEPLTGNGMYYLFYGMTILAIFITIGFLYRISMILFTLAFTYMFLIDKMLYLNHFYMVILFCILLCTTPANRYFSVDSYIRPQIKTNVINFWPIFLIRGQMEIILLFAGFVKINYDWLHLMPIKDWLDEGSSVQILDLLFRQKYSALVAAYGVIILHILGAPLLLWKRTRIYVFIIYCIFHITNAFTFKIGIFPWMTIALTFIFFEPDWPAKIFKFKEKARDRIFHKTPNFLKNIIFAFIVLWLLSQVLIPMRSILYPKGYIFWTHEGHDFSWRMKIQEVSGQTYFIIADKNSNRTKNFEYGELNSLHCDPDMILQFAHFLRDEWKKEGYDVKVFARSLCSLNRRRPQILIDPHVDLAAIERDLKHKTWVMPFDPETR